MYFSHIQIPKGSQCNKFETIYKSLIKGFLVPMLLILHKVQILIKIQDCPNDSGTWCLSSLHSRNYEILDKIKIITITTKAS